MSFVNTVHSIGENALMDSIITRTITEFKDEFVTVIGSHKFYKCSNLTSVEIPSVITISDRCFHSCINLTVVDLSKITSLDDFVFYGCSNLTTLIIRNTEVVCTLKTFNFVFYGTPIYNKTGYIYVPTALIDSYKADTQWGNGASQFRALEDYTVDGTINGALDETKI